MNLPVLRACSNPTVVKQGSNLIVYLHFESATLSARSPCASMEAKEEDKTKEVMEQIIEIERLAEEILSSKTIINEYINRKEQNKEALSALGHGEIQPG